MRAFRDTLDKAHFFLAQAEVAIGADRTAFRHYLEAAIVFGRSVTLHIQKELKHRPGFDLWYSKWQSHIGSVPRNKFLLEKRNYLLKEGPLAVSQSVTVQITSGLEIATSIGVVVVRGQPWYQRSPKILLGDLTWKLRERLRQWKSTRQRHAAVQTRVHTTARLHFAESEFSNVAATDLVRAYLDDLEACVEDAERAFPTEA